MKRLLWSLLLVPMLAFAGSINPGRDIQGFKPNTNGSGPASGVSTVGTLTSTQLSSTVSTGTAPLVVASTTTVANLSAATATTATTATNVTNALGQGQTLTQYSVGSTRLLNTPYPNSTSLPIFVMIGSSLGSVNTALTYNILVVNGITVGQHQLTSNGVSITNTSQLTAIVLPTQTYQVNSVNGGGGDSNSVFSWLELR